jgi:hypothetical protein
MIKNIRQNFFTAIAVVISSFSLASCAEQSEETSWKLPNSYLTPDTTSQSDTDSIIITRKAPLYWTVYEYCYTREQENTDRSLDEDQWKQMLDWVSTNLKPYGYEMVCTDGFMSMEYNSSDDPTNPDLGGYMTRYGGVKLKDLVSWCKSRGLKLGVYDNPLWLHGPDETPVVGSSGATFKDLHYNDQTDRDNVMYPDRGDAFNWVVPSHTGAKDYIDGFFKYYHDLGVDFIRMDFWCLFEDASGAGGMAGRGYGRTEYQLALKYINEAAAKYGVFTSIVMPNMYNDGKYEKKYMDMTRIVADCFNGGWDHCSNRLRGQVYNGWPTCHNQFDGFIHWNHITGRGKVIPDGDFLRLNTFSSDEERMTSVSLQLMAGGPVAIADNPIDAQVRNYNLPSMIKFAQNTELLALNQDGFVGMPLSEDLSNPNSQIWYGQMSDGDWIVGLFNREDNEQERKVTFSTLGITGERNVRDLWQHTDLGSMDALDVNIPAHGCKIYRLTESTQK